MTQELILWGIPGCISWLLFQLSRPTRNKSGWDFVAQISLFALSNFFLARILILLLFYLFPRLESLRPIWHRIFPQSGSFHLSVGLVVSLLTGIGWGKLWNHANLLLSCLSQWLSGRKRSFKFTDIFFATCDALLSKLVLLTLNNGKVYVGVLLEATDDPNETQRFIKIAPVMSGHRKKDDFKVVFDTDYWGNVERWEDLPNRDLLIAVSQVSTLAKFDQKLHEWFISTKRTEIISQPIETINMSESEL
jgi:hypothetical protein